VIRPTLCLVLLTATGACLRLHLVDEDSPIAVGAGYDVRTTNWRLQCQGRHDISCSMQRARVRSVQADPAVFDVEGPRLWARAAGHSRVRVTATIGDKTRSRSLRLEAAEPAEVDLWVGGGPAPDRLLMSPGAEVLVGWEAFDAEGRWLTGTHLDAFDEPTGRITFDAMARSALVRSPAESTDDLPIFGAHGGEVARIRISEDVDPDTVELYFPGGWGETANARLLGWRGESAVLGAPHPVTWESLTPEVCQAPLAASLGSLAVVAVLDAGECTLRATAVIAGQQMSDTATAPVALAIERGGR